MRRRQSVRPRATAVEVGVRSLPLPRWQTTVAFWGLDIDSELIFVGDAGTTEASRPSRRYGVEWSNFYRILPWEASDGTRNGDWKSTAHTGELQARVDLRPQLGLRAELGQRCVALAIAERT